MTDAYQTTILTSPFQLTWSLWIMAACGALLVGMAKAGIKGIGILIVTLLALSFGTKVSTGVLVPLLLVGDIYAIIYYHRHVQRKYLTRLAPWMMLGVLFGVYLGKDLPEGTFKHIMASIILISVVLLFWWERKPRHYIPDNRWFAGILGITAGFTSMVGNLAGPFTNLFFLAVRLPKNQFIGTVAWLYFIVNLFKLPFHIFVWKTITLQSLQADGKLLIFVFLGLLSGISIIKFIEEKQFRMLILILTAVGAIAIFLK